MRWALVAISLFLTWPGAAQDPYATAGCEPAKAETIFEVGNVRARLFNNGPLFWRGSPHMYEVPAGSGIHPIFAATFLAAGFIDGEIRVSGSSYGPYEMWPGPAPSGLADAWDCAPFDRMWYLDRATDFQREDALPSPSSRLLEWPVDLGAPFVDRNEVPGYQPEEGDYPFMNGDRQLWWIMNDRGNEHNRFRTPPLGVEVRTSVFGFDVGNHLGDVTFYRYHVTNTGPKTIENLTLGLHTDGDLGNPFDDRAGTDTTTALWYYYNADNDDEGSHGYGIAPPASGFAILELSHSGGSLPTDLDLPPSRNLGAARMYAGGGGVTGDAASASYLHQLMTGFWKDGSPQREGGFLGYEGWGGIGHPTPFYMPGDPVSGAFWSEVNLDGQGAAATPSDRRGIVSTPTFDLQPGEYATVTFAFVWARGADHLDSVVKLRELTQDLHESASTILAPRSLKPPLFEGSPSDGQKFPFWVDEPWPNPASYRLSLSYSLPLDGPVTVRIVDRLGRVRLVQEFNTSNGPDLINLDISSLSPGAYSISLDSRSHHADHSFVILR